MKKLIAIICVLVTLTAHAQTRGVYGTLQQYTSQTASIYNNVFTAKAADTLKGVDTVYLYFSFANPLRTRFTIVTNTVDDSLSGTAILQAYGGSTISGWLTRSTNWESITGQTALCTSCVGASKTYTLQTGTSYSTWDVGNSMPATFGGWRIRITGTRSTDTTAVTGYAVYSY